MAKTKKQMSEHQVFLRRAIALSRANVARGKGGPFGAVIVKDGKILGEGVNAVTAHNDPTAHAEVSAIRAACKKIGDFDLSGSVIYTSCEPCPMCLAAIYWAHLDRIYFGNSKADAAAIGFDDKFIYREFAKTAKQRKIPVQQMLRDEASSAFRIWEKSAQKIEY